MISQVKNNVEDLNLWKKELRSKDSKWLKIDLNCSTNNIRLDTEFFIIETIKSWVNSDLQNQIPKGKNGSISNKNIVAAIMRSFKSVLDQV